MWDESGVSQSTSIAVHSRQTQYFWGCWLHARDAGTYGEAEFGQVLDEWLSESGFNLDSFTERAYIVSLHKRFYCS